MITNGRARQGLSIEQRHDKFAQRIFYSLAGPHARKQKQTESEVQLARWDHWQEDFLDIAASALESVLWPSVWAAPGVKLESFHKHSPPVTIGFFVEVPGDYVISSRSVQRNIRWCLRDCLIRLTVWRDIMIQYMIRRYFTLRQLCWFPAEVRSPSDPALKLIGCSLVGGWGLELVKFHIPINSICSIFVQILHEWLEILAAK